MTAEDVEVRVKALEDRVADLHTSMAALLDIVVVEDELPALERAHRALVKRVREGAE